MVDARGGQDNINLVGREHRSAPTIDGGAGDDVIVGSDVVDTISGGDGNDRITGFRGNETINGGLGNDVMVWNNGEGNDINVGGAGIDETLIVTGTGDDNMTVVAERRADPDRARLQGRHGGQSSGSRSRRSPATTRSPRSPASRCR